VALGRRAYAAARIFTDVIPVPVDYQASVGGRVEPAFSTWTLRPGLSIEIGVY